MTGDDLLVDDTTTEIDRLASAWPQEYRLGYRFGFLNKADDPVTAPVIHSGFMSGNSHAATLGGAGGTKGASPSARPLQETTAMDKAPLLTSEEIAAAVAAEKAKHQRADGEQRGTSTNKRRDKSTKFKLVPFEEIRFVGRDEWTIKRLLPHQGLAVLFGSPGTFKSFLAMDLAFHVALGWDWAGRATTQGAAVYIAAENAGGTRKRKIGFEQAHDTNWRGECRSTW